jgi:autotransporter-associated beta strand protein
MSSANLVSGVGSKTLTLQGSNTGTNTLAQIINDDGGSTTVLKNGAGEWLLAAANTYSGPTTVNNASRSTARFPPARSRSPAEHWPAPGPSAAR